eukprot:15339458-Ditylum_brightwellii.AAC.1
MTKQGEYCSKFGPTESTPTKSVQWDSLMIVVEVLNVLPGFFQVMTILMMLFETINKEGEQEAPLES